MSSSATTSANSGSGSGSGELSTHRALLASILSYLSSLKRSPHSTSLLLSLDSLDAALDCLSEATGLPLPPPVDAAQPSQPTPPPPSLVDVYIAGVAALSSSASLSSAASSASSAAPFSQFVSLLTERGFFASLQPGSAAYAERLTAARAKYDEKYPDRSSASGGSSTLTAPSASSGSVSASDAQQAEQLKAEGNAYLSSQQYELAVARYSAAIALNPHSAIYFGNRAAAHINLSAWSEAESDCRAAIAIDAKYGKAHYRLGQSLLSQARAGEAVSAFESALQTTDASMRSTIDEQLAAARRQAQRDDDSDDGGASELTADAGSDADGGGMAGLNFASLLSNPMIKQMAAQLAGGAEGGGGLDFNALLNNPQLMQMASSMFGGAAGAGSGGGGGGGGGGGRAATGGGASSGRSAAAPAASLPSLPSLSAFLQSPAAASLLSEPELAPVLEDVRQGGLGR